ncbi:MAG: peptide chain release factor 2 [Clostridia bacterium]|nr:peptide chain release factor 2 [Clostridia bacterium]
MIIVDEQKYKLEELNALLKELGGALDLDGLKRRKAQLEEAQNADDFWNDLAKAQEINKELARVENKIVRYNKLISRAADCDALIMLLEEEGDEDSKAELDAELKSLEEDVQSLRLETLLKGKYDGNNAIITLHAGAGGTEAQDWASMLYRMYGRYAEREGYKTEVLDYLAGDEAGIKSVTVKVNGDNAYGYLKAEKGVHRLVRISPFDSNARRHTSFASVEVMPEVESDNEIKINPEELKIDTYRSGGAGGQHVNKTDSAVRITHLPTGIVVQCQNERSQIQNREQAMKMLTSKLIEKREREQAEKELELKGSLKKIEWGSQIRSYVFCPYTMVKDHRTGYETSNVTAVMDGDIGGFINDYLKKSQD